MGLYLALILCIDLPLLVIICSSYDSVCDRIRYACDAFRIYNIVRLVSENIRSNRGIADLFKEGGELHILLLLLLLCYTWICSRI
jgi:hypothetical protein